VSRSEKGDHLVLDGGPHGYLNCGHAHADALSLTFAFSGKPLLIDPGTACYTIDPEARDRFRSTAFHNTLTLDGRSQSTPRGPFHWASTADATTRRWRMNRQFDYFVGLHSGYGHLDHYRHVLVRHGDLLLVADCIVANGAVASDASSSPHALHEAAVHWHCDPRWSANPRDDHATLEHEATIVELHAAGGAITHCSADSATGLGWYSPAYGIVEPANTFRIITKARPPFWIVTAFGLDPSNRIQQLSLGDVDAVAASLHHGLAVRISRARTVDSVVIAEGRDQHRQARWRACDFESDAAMLYARQQRGDVASLGLVDASMLRSNRFPVVQQEYATTVRDVFVDFSDRGQSAVGTLASDDRWLMPTDAWRLTPGA
jgi:hypothetical protein